jgi:hypothetical protein
VSTDRLGKEQGSPHVANAINIGNSTALSGHAWGESGVKRPTDDFRLIYGVEIYQLEEGQ